MTVKIDKQALTNLIAIELGWLLAQGLFSNYPDNFNAMLPQMADYLEENKKQWLKEEK